MISVSNSTLNDRDLLEIPRQQIFGRFLALSQSLPFIGKLATNAIRVGRKRFISKIKSPERSKWIEQILKHDCGLKFSSALEEWSRQPSKPVVHPFLASLPNLRRCTVIVNTVDRALDLEKTLHDLKLSWNADLDELIIVLGPTTDNSEQVIMHSALPYKLIYCPVKNLAVSRNLGLTHATGRFVAYLDDDASPVPGWLEALIEPMENDQKVGITAGFVYDGFGKKSLNRYVVADTMGRAFWFDNVALAQDLIAQIGTSRAFLTATGCNMAFRRSAVDSVSGFDPFYQYFLEETDLVFRLLALGHRCEVVPASQVWHRLSTNMVRLSSFDIEARIVVARSQIHYIGKFGKSTFTPAEIESCLWERVLVDLEKIAWDLRHEGSCGEFQRRYLSLIVNELKLNLYDLD